MGWCGKERTIKSAIKKKEILNNQNLIEEIISFVKIESGYIWFKLSKDSEDLDEDNKTYILQFKVPFFNEYNSNNKWYTLKDMKNKIVLDYEDMILTKVTWKRRTEYGTQ